MLQNSGDAFGHFLAWFASVGDAATVKISYRPVAPVVETA
jgi:hypothetical protein